MNLDYKQREAVELSNDLAKRCIGITGQAGTGKTTVIRTVADELTSRGIRFITVAPTGKAARRIKEVTGLPAMTIHRALEYPRPYEFDEKTGKPLSQGSPKRNRTNPLDCKVVIADEYAMVATELHNNLLAAIPHGGAIRCFGDLNQLPPVEPYKIKTADSRSPFRRVLEDQPSVTLEHVYRQTEGSDILMAASRIRSGAMPMSTGQFKYAITNNPVNKLQDLVMEAEDNEQSYRAIDRQIISPTNKGRLGTAALNAMLRGLLNPTPTFEVTVPRDKYHQQLMPVTIGIGDKVVCTENMYDLRSWQDRFAEFDDGYKPVPGSFIPASDQHMMLNGETGIVTDISPEGDIEVDFGDRSVIVLETMYEFWAKENTIIKVDPRTKLELAYTLSTHKCQGSEYESVIYIMNNSMGILLNRENFYTAVTRARHQVNVLSDQMGISRSVRRKSAT